MRELALLDVNENVAAGQALDLLHGSPSVADQAITSGSYDQIPSSDIVCITAGLRRKPDESRLDLINRNTDLFVSILSQVKAAGLKQSAIVVVVSNPVDILTYVAAQRLGLPASQVIGLGTQLDTIRFCSLIADYLKAPPTQTRALILGSTAIAWFRSVELPRSEVFHWKSLTSGITQRSTQIFTRTKGSGAEVISKKGGAGFAVGIAIRDVIESIALDQRRILPVSSVQAGCYGIRDVALSVPTVVGRTGVLDRYEIELWPKELQGLRSSAAALRPTQDAVMKRIG